MDRATNHPITNFQTTLEYNHGGRVPRRCAPAQPGSAEQADSRREQPRWQQHVQLRGLPHEVRGQGEHGAAPLHAQQGV